MKQIFSIILTSIAFAFPVCSGNTQLYKDPSQAVEKRVNNLMAQMTLEEKIGQMCQYNSLAQIKAVEGKISEEEMKKSHNKAYYPGFPLDSIIAYTEKGLIGSFLYVIDMEEANYLQSLAQKSRLQIPLLLGIDAVHGNALYYGATVYPTAIGQAAMFSPELVEESARQTALEIRATGSHWTFAPNVEVARDARWGRTGETFGEDPYLVSVLGAATVKGLQSPSNFPKRGEPALPSGDREGVLACAKHFVGGGQSVNGINGAPLDVSERTIREVFFPPFKTAIEAGAYTVMVSHNEVNGIPAHGNRWLMTDVLRKEWNFNGFIVSDWMDVERMHDYHSVYETEEEAFFATVNAGLDMHMHGPRFAEGLIKAVKEGRLSEKRIEESVAKILTAKFQLGLFENPFIDANESKKVLFNAEHQKTALEMARKSIVLLKNHDNILPLDKNKYKKILVTGPNANTHVIFGDWAFPQPEENYTTVLKGLKNLSPETDFQFHDLGWKLLSMDSEEVRRAGTLARECDLAIVVVGENSMREHWGDKTCGENTDRSEITLPGLQQELVENIVKSGVPTVVVLVNGRPLGVEWIAENAAALIEAWEPGSFGGQAIAEILYGEVNPSAKLPITVPRHAGQIQMVYNHKFTTYWFPYRTGKSTPLYPFGFGLSYTNYKYDNLKISQSEISNNESVTLTVDVENTGVRDGEEIVQFYIRDEYSSAVRPLKELKDFRRIVLKSGEKKQVSFEITPEKLAFYDADMKFGVEKGRFKIMVGSSSRKEDLLETFLTVK
ncbi:MAG: glycoside hydrolase family 3 C-terminal domain-containing protein [Candidatus Symbiothrix sp.]|jgi:beta-glucosidase|nr:glycoside hydrolase family 3 C-terminal domain-containing protein [Candidatus Symbiothrix sp.]